jgi:hypothetical protein
VVTGIDDHSRFVFCARLVDRATAGLPCPVQPQPDRLGRSSCPSMPIAPRACPLAVAADTSGSSG